MPEAATGAGAGAGAGADSVRSWLRDTVAAHIVSARTAGPFESVQDLARRAGLDTRDLELLASADALQSLAGHRRQQVWEAAGQRRAPALLEGAPINETPLDLEAASEGEEIVFDYASLGLTLRRHPLALLRPRLERMKMLTSKH